MNQTRTEKTKPEAFKKGKTGLEATLIEQWIAEHYEGLEDILGKEGLLAKLTKAVVERVLGAELTHHLGYAPGGAPRPCSAKAARWRSRCRATVTARSSRA